MLLEDTMQDSFTGDPLGNGCMFSDMQVPKNKEPTLSQNPWHCLKAHSVTDITTLVLQHAGKQLKNRHSYYYYYRFD